MHTWEFGPVQVAAHKRSGHALEVNITLWVKWKVALLPLAGTDLQVQTPRAKGCPVGNMINL